ncbi:hypothetical protein O181_048907 [Austropuccinia psidii MF-1]|uniref:Uncharacterized protein n=1 Tax=Austropuccinia psidii MF-1 TaxID=1389203 RepID=A0A9Q3E0R9_9BASI|nr:hypothetical protein [Austropuccinia psidii MF-1]
MSPVHLRDLGFQRNQPEDRQGLSRTRRPERGHLGHRLERHGSSSSAPPTPQRFISMEHGQQEVQPGIPLGRTWSKLPEYLSQRDRPQRPYGNHQRLESYHAVQTPGGEIPSGSQGAGKISSPVASHHPKTNRSVAKSHHSSQSQEVSSKTRIQGQTQDHLQPEEERVRPNDPEAVGCGKRSSQEPHVVVHNSRISISINRNITPTQIDHNVVTPESKLNSDSLWLQMSQYTEQTKKQFSELNASHEMMKNC